MTRDGPRTLRATAVAALALAVGSLAVGSFGVGGRATAQEYGFAPGPGAVPPRPDSTWRNFEPGPAPPPYGWPTWNDGAVPGQFAVCGDTVDPEQFEDLGLTEVFELTSGVFVGNTPWPSFDGEKYAQRLESQLGGVCIVEPDLFAHLPEGSQSNSIVVGSELGRSFQTQKAFRAIRRTAAHRKATGEGVLVAVLDSGVDATHSFLAGRVEPGFDFVDRDGDVRDEPDGVDDDFDGEVDEGVGHGTMVAGIVLATAPDARVLPVRVLDSEGRGTASGVAAGIRYAIDGGADVINLSLGMPRRSRVVEEQVRAALDAGVVVIVAAGNAGRARRVDFPGTVPGVVAVTAAGRRGRRARFANGTASIRAPGTRVIGPYPGETWGQGTGTSFAAPMVSGAAALMLSRDDRATGKGVSRAIARRVRLRLDRLLR